MASAVPPQSNTRLGLFHLFLLNPRRLSRLPQQAAEGMGPVLSADWFWLRKRRRAAGGGCSEAFAARRHSDPERMRGELLAARAWFQGACPWPLFRAFLAGQKGTSGDRRCERNKNRK